MFTTARRSGRATEPVMDNTPTPPNNFLNWVEIKNFKSIKDLRLDCKRVNVFIGKPNVGKSNILEALGLFGLPSPHKKLFDGSIRYEQLRQLFYDNNINNTIGVSSDKYFIFLRTEQINNDHVKDIFFYTNHSMDDLILSSHGKLKSNFLESFDQVYTKKYNYINLSSFNNSYSEYLLPPNGSNLFEVIRRNKDLQTEFAQIFSAQHLDLVLYDEKQELILQKKDGPLVWQYPFFSIADTFRRYIFYLTAIESNKDSVLIFEEPEVHSFPPYVKSLAHRMASSETNQFFIATHSPYLLNTLIDELDEADLSVFITYYQDYQTHVRALTADELLEARNLGIDLFYNLSRYEPNA